MSPIKRSGFSPLFVLFIGILAASTASIMIRNAQVYAPSIVIAAYRLSLATLILAPFALASRRGEIRTLQKKDLRLAVLSGFFLAVHFGTWISSLAFTTVASSAVLVSTIPLWVALLSPFTIKEKISRFAKIGMGFTLVGVIIIAASDTCTWSQGNFTCPSASEFFKGKAFIGDLLALTGAVMGACYLLIGRSLRSKMSLLSYVFVVYGIAAVGLVIFMLISGNPVTGYPPQAYFWFLMLALVPQLLGHSSFNYALRHLSAAYVSISLLGEPIGSTILAYFLLDERPSTLKIFGAILILAGIYIATRSEVSGEQTDS